MLKMCFHDVQVRDGLQVGFLHMSCYRPSHRVENMLHVLNLQIYTISFILHLSKSDATFHFGRKVST